jgi:hypothetical protein
MVGWSDSFVAVLGVVKGNRVREVWNSMGKCVVERWFLK